MSKPAVTWWPRSYQPSPRRRATSRRGAESYARSSFKKVWSDCFRQLATMTPAGTSRSGRTRRSLEQPGGAGDAEGASTVGDLIPDVAAERAYDTVLDAIEQHEVRKLT